MFPSTFRRYISLGTFHYLKKCLLIVSLLQAADYDVDRASKGIIYIDEIDKIARKSGDDAGLVKISISDISSSSSRVATTGILPTNSGVPTIEGLRRCVITEEVVLNTGEPLYFYEEERRIGA